MRIESAIQPIEFQYEEDQPGERIIPKVEIDLTSMIEGLGVGNGMGEGFEGWA